MWIEYYPLSFVNISFIYSVNNELFYRPLKAQWVYLPDKIGRRYIYKYHIESNSLTETELIDQFTDIITTFNQSEMISLFILEIWYQGSEKNWNFDLLITK